MWLQINSSTALFLRYGIGNRTRDRLIAHTALSDDHLLASFEPYLKEKNSKTAMKPNFGCVATSGHGAATFHS
ncbi:hypothetical protein Y032_0157g3208 [Ancylostoma ceylanicum]|uniref:Uncharacterized protein n=1 Tax=Ancylostoma ceylanicum TaxID=53326 RepID=A0A016SZ06_9BILA|nr:hypothetical protein Y032_0157g3208 [Ancylostoma ceylanicum]